MNIPGSHQEEWLVGPRWDLTPRPCRDTQEVLRSLPTQGSAGGELSFHLNQSPWGAGPMAVTDPCFPGVSQV